MLTFGGFWNGSVMHLQVRAEWYLIYGYNHRRYGYSCVNLGRRAFSAFSLVLLGGYSTGTGIPVSVYRVPVEVGSPLEILNCSRWAQATLPQEHGGGGGNRAVVWSVHRILCSVFPVLFGSSGFSLFVHSFRFRFGLGRCYPFCWVLPRPSSVSC